MQNKRSKWKNQYKRIQSSSKFHERVRRIFCEDSFFSGLSCFQEVPVKALVPGYPANHFVDWFVDEIGTIIELHGEHHYSIVNFGNVSFEKSRKDFYNIKYKDNQKKFAITEAGYEYREISYKLANKIDSEMMKNILFKGN